MFPCGAAAAVRLVVVHHPSSWWLLLLLNLVLVSSFAWTILPCNDGDPHVSDQNEDVLLHCEEDSIRCSTAACWWAILRLVLLVFVLVALLGVLLSKRKIMMGTNVATGTENHTNLLLCLAQASRGVAAVVWKHDEQNHILQWVRRQLVHSMRHRTRQSPRPNDAMALAAESIVEFVGGLLWFHFHVDSMVHRDQPRKSSWQFWKDADDDTGELVGSQSTDGVGRELLQAFVSPPLARLLQISFEAILDLVPEGGEDDDGVWPVALVELFLEEIVWMLWSPTNAKKSPAKTFTTPNGTAAESNIKDETRKNGLAKSTSKRILGYLRMLNLVHYNPHESENRLVRVNGAAGLLFPSAPHRHALSLSSRQRLIARLAVAENRIPDTVKDDFPMTDASLILLRSYWPRLCTRLRLYGPALSLLQDPPTAQAYLDTASKIRKLPLATAVQQWIQDGIAAVNCLQQGMATVPSGFLKNHLCTMLTCLLQYSVVEHTPGSPETGSDTTSALVPSLELVDALHLLATRLVQPPVSAYAEALDCLDHSMHSILLPQLITLSVELANSIWYTGIVLWTRGDRDTGQSCLRTAKAWTTSCGHSILPTNLLAMLRQTVQPLFLNNNNEDDKGLEFCRIRIRRNLERLQSVCWRMARLETFVEKEQVSSMLFWSTIQPANDSPFENCTFHDICPVIAGMLELG